MSQAAANYRLTGPHAHAGGGASWYRTAVPRSRLKELMQRRDGPAVRDTLLWLALLGAAAAGAVHFHGSWIAVPFFAAYGVLYGSASDARWHECGHCTAFRTQWMNRAVHQMASFMIMREPEVTRWSHARHHTDTLIVGRDPEIAVKRPPNIPLQLLSFFPVLGAARALGSLVRHASGRLTPDERVFIPAAARGAVFRTARIWLVLHAGAAALSAGLGSWLPVLLFGALPTVYGGWLARYCDLTQHAGLAENVRDHRLSARTIRVNPVLGFLYWNMNYHVEHHMFPMVPYHALPALHELVWHDMPPAYPSTFAAYREIIPAVLRQSRDPDHCVMRPLPTPNNPGLYTRGPI